MTDKLGAYLSAVFTGKDGIRAPDVLGHINEALRTTDSVGYTGKVTLAGRTINEYSVCFEMEGTGYGSAWPEWAYQAARDALLTGKRLYVVSSGEPFGFNLSVALVTAEPV